VRSTTPAIPLRVAAGSAQAGVPALPSSPRPIERGGPLRLRTELGDSGAGHGIPGAIVGLVALAALLLHALLASGERLGRMAWRRGDGTPRRTAPRGARGALRDLDRVGRERMSKETATVLIEKTIHSVFGPLDGDDSERARAVRALLDEVHGVRYAPQLGDYSEQLRELAQRTSDIVRRWA
jgi:hypothetical protein